VLLFQWNLTDHHIFNHSLIYPLSFALFSSRALIHINYILLTNCLCHLSLPSPQLYCKLLKAEFCLPCSLLGPSLLEWVLECIRHALYVCWINSKDMVVSEGWTMRLKGGSWAYLVHLLCRGWKEEPYCLPNPKLSRMRRRSQGCCDQVYLKGMRPLWNKAVGPRARETGAWKWHRGGKQQFLL